MKTGALFEKVEKIKMPIRIAIFLGTLVLLAGLFIYFVYLPYSEEIAKSRDEIAKLQQKLNQAVVRARALKKFEAEYAEVDAQFQEALKLLPNTKEIPSLLKSITQLGTDSQLEFLNFSPQRERPQDFFMEIPVSIEVKGTYHNVAVFFDKVGQMERIVNILNVSMTPLKERSTILTTRCDAVTYRFKGETDATQQPKK
ncbi:MAG: type 4a pilus biogenesis protein PilO [Deltaproteobacteria bacterium]|jgi:type IV pilus assembly protein PilO|nr:type 4a pilus biogenesis protein PilO [Deltaproteobacteria bacterium]NTV56768.1 type 4a pilus biogenesis protein PilO [Deltaproteobacteria bacterium]